MINKEEIDERRKEFAEELHAGSVYRDIQSREKERPIYEKRWFWELLQNAKDSVDNDKEVDVYIKISDKEILFSHTGNPFKLDEILSLIIQGTTKTEGDKTGRFGTGFLTTYLLSKKVEITGCLTQDNGYFQFFLNRDSNDLKEFFKLQQKSNDDFDNSMRITSYVDISPFQTRFRYELDHLGQQTSEIGLKSLNDLIPFVQIFNNQIHSIKVEQNGITTEYKKEIVEKNDSHEKWKLSVLINEVLKSESFAYLLQGDGFETCFLTKHTLDGKEVVINLDNKYPKLYYTFPLIGTEDLGIPFIINSTEFDPKVERDGIYLGYDNILQEGVLKNRELIINALNSTIELIADITIDKNFKNVFEFFNFYNSNPYPWLDNNWLNKEKVKMSQKLFSTEIIFNHSNEKRCLDELFIPFSIHEELNVDLWRIFECVNSYDLIPLEELENWINIMKNIAKIENEDICNYSNIVDIEELMCFIEQISNLKELKDETLEPLIWLNKFYNIILLDLEEFPLDRKIVLNQSDEFAEGVNICWDNIKDDTINDISNKIGLNFPGRLISKNIEPIEIIGISSFEKDYATLEIKNKLNQASSVDYQNIQYQQANSLFLKWLINNDKREILKDFKVISYEKDSNSPELLLQPFLSGKHLLLTPKTFFGKEYPLYADLIREKDCLHPVYIEYLNELDFKWLENNGFIHFSPLVKRIEKLDSKTAEWLIQDSKDLAILKDEEGKINGDYEITYNDFAYLTTSEGHIYDRNSTTKSSIKILNFLLNEATIKDKTFHDSMNQIQVNGSIINFDNCLWLKRARNLQWVNVKNVESSNETKFNSEIASSKNLAEIIKLDKQLIQTIKGELQISFLTKIGVGVSDLIRNTLPSDEDRISWDKALTTMITSDIDPKLAQEIFLDPNIQAEYTKRIMEKKIIKRNQDIGRMVEELFDELINDLKNNGINITIERKPWGSDYLLSDDSSDFVVDGNLQIFQINNWLVELKASGRDYAAMTEKQAKTAVDNKENYALIVVPLMGETIDKSYISENARVVNNIGYNLSEPVMDLIDLEERKDSLVKDSNGVSISIEDQRVRFQINSKLWYSSNSKTLLEFVLENFSVKQSIGVMN